MIMKKKILILTFALMIGLMGLTGCTEEKKAGKSTTEEVDSYTSEMEDTLGGQLSAPSEAVTKAVSNTWAVQGSNDIYELKTDGTGKKNDEDLTFECGFDDEKNITLQMKIGDAEMLYAISTDETGYGIELTSLDGGEDLYFLPADLAAVRFQKSLDLYKQIFLFAVVYGYPARIIERVIKQDPQYL